MEQGVTKNGPHFQKNNKQKSRKFELLWNKHETRKILAWPLPDHSGRGII